MNYTESLAEIFRRRLPGLAIYSNVDPAREWNGTQSVEFIETDSALEYYISGAYRRYVNVAVAIRAESQDEASTTGQGLKEILTEVLDEIKDNGVIESWTYGDEGTTPDARGVASGESFYWYQDFQIVENRKL
ncbi:MAG: hypothetical protein IJL92_08785 [Thermoguttaceae bacterium]|nr:hypothetical protein [Thermoguttaceae bacterium]